MLSQRVALFSVAFAGAVALQAVPVQIAQRSDVGWTDSLPWSSAAAEFDSVVNPTTLSTTGGRPVTVSLPGGGFDGIRLDQGSGWLGGFAAGENLLYTDIQDVSVELAFSGPVFGVGAEIQPDFSFISAYTARIEAFDSGGGSLGAFNIASLADAVAFLGVNSTLEEISRVRFTITGLTDADPNDGNDPFVGFAINQVSLRGGLVDPRTDVPEGGSTLVLLLLGLFCAALLGVHRQAVRRLVLAAALFACACLSGIAQPVCSKLYTLDADFDLGTLFNVNHNA